MAAYQVPHPERDERRRRQHRWVGGAGLALLWGMIVVAAFVADWEIPDRHLPWGQLDLADPIGVFTRGKISRAEGPACRMILAQGGLSMTEIASTTSGEFCSQEDVVQLTGGTAPLSPSNVVMTCSEAVAFALWERQVVQPAAFEHLGTTVVGIENYGTYACRRQYGAKTGPVSEHARANAMDVAAFTLADGRRVSIAQDWNDPGEKGTFLRAVRDGACRVFAVTLSPDFNVEHADHLHLDMGQGPFCR